MIRWSEENCSLSLIELAVFLGGTVMMLYKVRRTDGRVLNQQSIRNVAMLMIFIVLITVLSVIFFAR